MNHRGEHTWGLAGGHCKGLSFNSTHEQLLGSSNLTCVRTWQEQRQFIQNAIQALVDAKHSCADDFVNALAEISASGLRGRQVAHRATLAVRLHSGV